GVGAGTLEVEGAGAVLEHAGAAADVRAEGQRAGGDVDEYVGAGDHQPAGAGDAVLACIVQNVCEAYAASKRQRRLQRERHAAAGVEVDLVDRKAWDVLDDVGVRGVEDDDGAARLAAGGHAAG